MSHKHLSAYLNDHLAGSVAILELLSHTASAYAGSDVERFANQLRAEIVADRGELEEIMGRVGVGQSTPRKASAWLAEKFAQIKVRLDDGGDGSLQLLELMEAASIGIEGKRLLLKSLKAAAAAVPELGGKDYDGLIARAEDQRRRVEAFRLEAVKSALTNTK